MQSLHSTPKNQRVSLLNRHKHSQSIDKQFAAITNRPTHGLQRQVIDEPSIIDKLNQVYEKDKNKDDQLSPQTFNQNLKILIKRTPHKSGKNSLTNHANGFKFSQKQNFFGIQQLAQNKKNYRLKYKKIRQKLQKYLQKLQAHEEASACQISCYQQEVLSLFLNDFIDQTKKQCIDKGDLLEFIWQSIFSITGKMMTDLVKNSKEYEQQTLKQMIHNHTQYQKTIQNLKHKYEQVKKKLQLNEKYTSSLVQSIRFKKRELKKLYNGIMFCQKQFSETKQDYLNLQSQHIDLLMQRCQVQIAQARQMLQRKKCVLIQRQRAINKFKPKNIKKQVQQELKNGSQITSKNVEKSLKQKFCQDINVFQKQIVFQKQSPRQQAPNVALNKFLAINFDQILDGAESSCKDLAISPESQKKVEIQNERNIYTSTFDLQWGSDFNSYTSYNQRLIYQIIANRGTQTLENKKVKKNDMEAQVNDGQIRRLISPYQITKVYQFNLFLKEYRQQGLLNTKIPDISSSIISQNRQKLTAQQTQALNLFNQALKQIKIKKSKLSLTKNAKHSSFLSKMAQAAQFQLQTVQESNNNSRYDSRYDSRYVQERNSFRLKRENKKSKKIETKNRLFRSKQNSVEIQLLKQNQYERQNSRQNSMEAKNQNLLLPYQEAAEIKVSTQVNKYSDKKGVKTKKVYKQKLKKGGFISDQTKTVQFFFNHQPQIGQSQFGYKNMSNKMVRKHEKKSKTYIENKDVGYDDLKKYLKEYQNKSVKKMPLSNYKSIIKSLSHVFSIAFKMLQRQQPPPSLIVPLKEHFKLEYGVLKPDQLHSRMIGLLGQIYLHRSQSSIFDCFIFLLGFGQTAASQTKYPKFDKDQQYGEIRISFGQIIEKEVQALDLHFFLKLINQLSLKTNNYLDLQQLRTTKRIIQSRLQNFLKAQGFCQTLIQKILNFMSAKMSVFFNSLEIKNSVDVYLDVFKCAKNIVQLIICLKREVMKSYQCMFFTLKKDGLHPMPNYDYAQTQEQLISEKLIEFLIECQFKQRIIQLGKKSQLSQLRKPYLTKSLQANKVVWIEKKKAASYLQKFQIPQLAQLYYLAINKFKLTDTILKDMNPDIQNYIKIKLKNLAVKGQDQLIQVFSELKVQSFNDKRVQTLAFLNTYDKEATQLLQQMIGQQMSFIYCKLISTLLG